jgi:hypothetical protein
MRLFSSSGWEQLDCVQVDSAVLAAGDMLQAAAIQPWHHIDVLWNDC